MLKLVISQKSNLLLFIDQSQTCDLHKTEIQGSNNFYKHALKAILSSSG